MSTENNQDTEVQAIKAWLNTKRGTWPAIAEGAGVTKWFIYSLMRNSETHDHRHSNIAKLKKFKDKQGQL